MRIKQRREAKKVKTTSVHVLTTQTTTAKSIRTHVALRHEPNDEPTDDHFAESNENRSRSHKLFDSAFEPDDDGSRVEAPINKQYSCSLAPIFVSPLYRAVRINNTLHLSPHRRRPPDAGRQTVGAHNLRTPREPTA